MDEILKKTNFPLLFYWKWDVLKTFWVKKYFTSEKNILFIRISGHGHVHVYYPSHTLIACAMYEIEKWSDDLKQYSYISYVFFSLMYSRIWSK
jgi:hypothetical protein